MDEKYLLNVLVISKSAAANDPSSFSSYYHFGTQVNSSGSQKTAGSHVALRRNISAPVQVTDLVEVSKDAASLVVCTRKKFFG